jgi:hypothetical protein
MALFNDRGQISQRIREQLARDGWTCRARWIDNRPRRILQGQIVSDGELIGFRFTNAEALLENALSIQVFDRSTVSLSFDGFTNDDHLSFTDEDGRELLEWMRNQPESPLTAEFWNELPEAQRKELQPAAMTTGKGHLVAWLARHYPHIFGTGGQISTEGTDFYEEVQRILENQAPQPLRVTQLQMIQQLEDLAHQFYTMANALLRAASTPGPDDGMERARHHASAYGIAQAAQECRIRAAHVRESIEKPPPPGQFNDAPPPIDVLDIIGFVANQEDIAPRKPKPSTLVYRTDDVIVVTDVTHARDRQIGKVKSATLTEVLVEFSAMEKPEWFLVDQVEPWFLAAHKGQRPK